MGSKGRGLSGVLSAHRLSWSQPWLKGFNGENQLGVIDYHRVHVRIWIDQELKQEMGY